MRIALVDGSYKAGRGGVGVIFEDRSFAAWYKVKSAAQIESYGVDLAVALGATHVVTDNPRAYDVGVEAIGVKRMLWSRRNVGMLAIADQAAGHARRVGDKVGGKQRSSGPYLIYTHANLYPNEWNGWQNLFKKQKQSNAPFQVIGKKSAQTGKNAHQTGKNAHFERVKLKSEECSLGKPALSNPFILEEALWDQTNKNSKAFMRALTYKATTAVSVDGRMLTRTQMLKEMESTHLTAITDKWKKPISENVIELSYRFEGTVDDEPAISRRVSLWKWQGREWRLLSHSASPAPGPHSTAVSAAEYALALRRIKPRSVGDFEECPTCLCWGQTLAVDIAAHKPGCAWIAAHGPLTVN